MEKLPELDTRVVKWGSSERPRVGDFVRITDGIAYPSFMSDATGGVIRVLGDNEVECFEE